jgi:hypothetical protein
MRFRVVVGRYRATSTRPTGAGLVAAASPVKWWQNRQHRLTAGRFGERARPAPRPSSGRLEPTRTEAGSAAPAGMFLDNPVGRSEPGVAPPRRSVVEDRGESLARSGSAAKSCDRRGTVMSSVARALDGGTSCRRRAASMPPFGRDTAPIAATRYRVRHAHEAMRVPGGPAAPSGPVSASSRRRER